jgi:hypothetical protein
MARTLTTPEVQPDAVQQALSGFRIEVPHIRNAGDTSMIISLDQVQVWYEVITYDTDGLIIKKATRIVPFADWSASFKTEVDTVYNHLVDEAEAAGLIAGPGTDEPLG